MDPKNERNDRYPCACFRTAAPGGAGAGGARGRKRFRGILGETEGDAVRLRREDAAPGEQEEFLLPIEDMADAKLVLTDELMSEALRRSKAEERQAREESIEQRTKSYVKHFRR